MYYLDVADLMPEVYDIVRLIPVRRLDLVSDNVTTVATIRTSVPRGVSALEVRHDGKYFAWVGWREHSAEIMLIRDLHLGTK